MIPFRPRPVRFHGIRSHAGWKLKEYSITYGAEIGLPDFEPGMEMALASLPEPAVTPERPGAGFVIAHRGRSALYVVLAWWDRENELPVRVFIGDLDDGEGWRPARGGESFCVWDLQVIGFERDAYVATVLAGSEGGGVDAYLARRIEVSPEPETAAVA